MIETFKYVVTYIIVMHIEKRKVNGKTKYYLAHSFREGSSVHKFRKYLGQDLKPEKPEIVVDTSKLNIKEVVDKIYNYLKEKNKNY